MTQDVLHLSAIGDEDRIFALGANSLHVFRIVAPLAKGDIAAQVRDFMSNPTIAELAAVVEQRMRAPGKGTETPSLRSFRHGIRRRGQVSEP